MSPTPPLSPILQAVARAPGRSSKRSPKSKATRGADTFCAEGHLQDGALTVSVEDLGLLTSPLPPTTAQALHAASTPARHGQRDKTVLDKRVRDTGELDADALTLRWFAMQAALAALHWMSTGHGYELTALAVMEAHRLATQAARSTQQIDQAQAIIEQALAPDRLMSAWMRTSLGLLQASPSQRHH